jgi:protoporphyrinogen/coproporphyrinogen III oxidase
MTDTRWDLLIVGAGISGLTLAHYARSAGWRTLVLEAENRPGGCVHSHRPEGTDFWLELGAHTAFNSYRNLLGVIEAEGLAPQITPKANVNFRFYADGQVQSLFSQIGFGELFRSLPRLLSEKKAGQTVRAYYSRVLGEKNYQRLFGHAFNAVICQEAADFPADILFGQRQKRKDVTRRFTFPAGMQTLTDTLAGGREVRLGCTARQVLEAEGGFEVLAGEGERLRTRRLALATAADAASALLGEADPNLAAHLSAISTVTVESLGVAVEKKALQLPLMAGLIGGGQPFYSMVARDAVGHDRFRGFTFHFRPGALPPDRQLALGARVLGVPDSALHDPTYKQTRLPALRVGHARWLEKLDAMLAGLPLAVTGNYFTGVSMEDCTSRSRQEFERLASLA